MTFNEVRKYVTDLLKASFLNKRVLDKLSESDTGKLLYNGNEISNGNAEGSVNLSNYYTKNESDTKYALKTELPTIPSDLVRTSDISDVVRTSDITNVVRTSDISDVVRTQTLSSYLTKSNASTLYEAKGTSYSKTDSDNRYLLKNQAVQLPSNAITTDNINSNIPSDVVRDSDISDVVRTNDISDVVRTNDLKTYAKVTQLPDMSSYYTKEASDERYMLKADSNTELTAELLDSGWKRITWDGVDSNMYALYMRKYGKMVFFRFTLCDSLTAGVINILPVPIEYLPSYTYNTSLSVYSDLVLYLKFEASIKTTGEKELWLKYQSSKTVSNKLSHPTISGCYILD